MEKLKPIKTLDQNLLSMTDFNDPSTFDPVLSKISHKSLISMFENDLAFSIKAIKFNSYSNNQRLLNINLFLTTWTKYGRFLPSPLYASRLVESGEQLMQIKGFHNLANSHCFTKIIGLTANDAQMERLLIRAKYGQAIYDYIQILEVDPLLKSPLGKSCVDKVLSDLITLIDQCDEKEELAGLILTGSYHIRNICDHLTENGNHDLAVKYLTMSISYLENNIELSGAEFLTWLVDNVKVTFNALLAVLKIPEANNLVLQTIEWIKYIEQLEMKAKYLSTLPEDLKECIDSALYEMNLLLFGCEIRALTGFMYVGSAQNSSIIPISDHGLIGKETLLKSTTSIPFRKSWEQILKILKGQIDRLCGKGNSNSLYKINHNGAAFSFQENARANKDFKNMVELYISEKSIRVEPLIEQDEAKEVPVSESIEELEEQDLNKSHRKTGRKEKMENAEDLKIKKYELKVITTKLQMFSDDRGKIAAINSALFNLGVQNDSLFTYDKCPELSLANIIKQLITLGFYIITSKGALDGHILMKQISECKKGRLNTSINVQRLADLKRFDLADLVEFSRYLFVQEYWGQFLRISLNNEISSWAAFKSYKNELAIRTRSISFDVSFHADRMVGFSYSQESITKSLMDLKKRRQKIGMHVEASIIGFMVDIYLCLIDNNTSSRLAKLLSDASYILWRFVEPFFSDINLSKKQNAPLLEDIIITAIHAAHCISSQIFNSSNLAFSISSSYALFLELNGEYAKSIEILLNSIDLVKRLRLRLGENGAPFINSLLEEATIANKYQGKMLVKSLACDHVDLLQAYYRCCIKQHHAKTIEDVRNREEQHFRLSQKRITIDLSYKESDLDHLMRTVCGESYSHRAIFLMVFSSTATHYEKEIRKKSMKMAFNYLKQAVEYEKYLKQLSTEKPGRNATLAFRSHDCIALKIASDDHCFAKLFCGLKSVNSMVPIYSTKFKGTGERISISGKVQSLLFIQGLRENTVYEICGSLTGIGETDSTMTSRICIITGNMLPLIFCWEIFCLTAPSLGYLNLALNGLQYLWSYFIDTPFTANHCVTNILPREPALLKYDNIERENPTLLDNFIKVIIFINDEEYHPLLTAYFGNLVDHTLFQALNDFRFRAIERLLVAISISKITHNLQGELQSSIRCFGLTESLMKTNSENTSSIPIMSIIHSSMMHSIFSLENNITQGVAEYIIPTTRYFVRLLKRLGMHEQMLKLCTDVLEHIHRFCVINDLRIKCGIDDQSVRSSLPIDATLKNLSSSQEFLHHEFLAISPRWKTGYSSKRTEFDEFCEYLEAQIVYSCFKIPSILENPHVSDVLRKELSRRSLDSQPTIKEIQILFENTHSPDMVLREVVKFRKNSRFIEITAKIVGWAIDSHNFEQGARICSEIEEWHAKRNAILSTTDLSPEEYQKWESVMKKKKVLIKFDKKSDPELKNETRGRSHSPTDRRSSRINSAPNSGRKKKEGAGKKEFTKKKESSPDRQSSSSRERGERSVSPEEKRPSLSSKVSNSGRKLAELKVEDHENKNSHIEKRRRKITKKQQYFEGMSVDERNRMEKAAKVLDKNLTSLWYRFRVRRRLLLVLNYEAPSRVSISLMHAECLFNILKKDLNLKGYLKKESLDFDVMIGRAKKSLQNSVNDEKEKILPIPNNLLNTAREVFYHYTCGMNLATRFGQWIQLLRGAKQMHDAFRYLAALSIFESCIWKDHIWKWFYAVADNILDCLQTVDLIAENSLPTTLYASIQYLKSPDYSKAFPVDSREDIYDYSWNILYRDVNGSILRDSISMTFIIQFLQNSLEIMIRAKKFNRRALLLDRLEHIFPNCDLFPGEIQVFSKFKSSSYMLLQRARYAKDENKVECYEQSILKARDEGSLINQLIGLHELGNFFMKQMIIVEAARYWMNSLHIVFLQNNILKDWPEILAFDPKMVRINGLFQTSLKILKFTKNAKLSIMMGLMISKLAHYHYSKNEDFQNHLVLLAVSCLLAPFSIIPPRASKFEDFALYDSAFLSEILDNFSAKYEYHQYLILDDILWLIDHCHSSQLPDLVAPLTCIFKHIYKSELHSSFQRTITQVAEVESLDQLQLPSEAFSLLKNLKSGIYSYFPLQDPTDLIGRKGGISEFLELSSSEFSMDIYSQELLTMCKMKCIVNSWLSKSSMQFAYQESRTIILEKLKILYVQKVRHSGIQKAFYDRIEIIWTILMGDLCFLESKFGLCIKWYFTAMDAIHEFISYKASLDLAEYAFISIPRLRFHILERTIIAFLGLRHLDVANHMACSARKEAESLGMNLRSVKFASLQTMTDSTPSFTFSRSSELKKYIHQQNFEMYSTALEFISDYSDNSLQDIFSTINFTYKRQDLLRLKMKHFLKIRRNSKIYAIQDQFSEMDKIYKNSEFSVDISQKYLLLKARNTIELAYCGEIQNSDEFMKIKKDLIDLTLKLLNDASFTYSQIRQSLSLIASIEVILNLNPDKWIYLLTKLSMRRDIYKILKKLPFEIDTALIPQDLLYDLELFNVTNQISDLGRNLPYPFENPVLEKVLKYSDPLLAIPEINLSDQKLFEIVDTLEDPLLDPYFPFNDPWKTTCEHKLRQILSFADSNYQWDLQPEVFENAVPTDIFCIQWLETREPQHDQSDLFKLYFCAANSILFKSKSLISKNTLNTLVEKTRSLLMALQRSSQIPDNNFFLKAKENWNDLLKELIAFFIDEPLKLKYLEPKITLVECLMRTFDITRGFGYGADLTDSCADPESTKIFFEWIFRSISP